MITPFIASFFTCSHFLMLFSVSWRNRKFKEKEKRKRGPDDHPHLPLWRK